MAFLTRNDEKRNRKSSKAEVEVNSEMEEGDINQVFNMQAAQTVQKAAVSQDELASPGL